jgi:hypothetical protein
VDRPVLSETQESLPDEGTPEDDDDDDGTWTLNFDNELSTLYDATGIASPKRVFVMSCVPPLIVASSLVNPTPFPPEHRELFEELKREILAKPVLARPDPDRRFFVKTD